MKPEKCGFADFEYIFNWIIGIMMEEFMQEGLYDEKRIKIFRDVATLIFISYEKELIGKTSFIYDKELTDKIKPACKKEILDEIINRREELKNILDKFSKHESNDIESEIQRIRFELENLYKCIGNYIV